MRIALITDTHFGIKSDSIVFLNYFEKFYKNIFFPYLKKNKIDTVIHLGDLFDRRKYINYVSLSRAKAMFFDILAKEQIKTHVIVGNHDCSHKQSSLINSPLLLLKDYSNVIVYSDPTDIEIDGTKILLLPWMNEDNVTKNTRENQKN